MLNALLVKKDGFELIEIDENKIHNDEYVCNILGIDNTITSSSLRYINSCAFRIYHQDYIKDIKWYSGIHINGDDIKGDIPEEAIFIPVNQFVDAEGELDEEILNIEKLYQFVLEERIGYIQMVDENTACAVVLD